MRREVEIFKPLPKDALEQSVIKAEGILGKHIAPSSLGKDIYTAPLEEIKRAYPFRYQLYLDALRGARNNRPGSIADFESRVQRLSILNNIDRSNLAHSETSEVLYERQRDVYQDIHEFLETGGTEGYVKLPTGTGKTVLFSKIVEAAGVKTLITVPRGYLIDQTSDRLEQFTDLKAGQVSKVGKDWGQDVTIMTYDYLIKAVNEGLINPDDYGLLILDEAHRALGKKTRDAVKAFSNSIKLGFTATPNYSEFKKLANLLPTEIHNMSIREAVEEGLLCSFSVIIAETEANISEVSVTSDGEYNSAELERAVNIESRNEAAVNLYVQEFSGQSGAFYCAGVDHAEEVANKLNSQGITAAVISGRQSRKVQQDILEKYQNGEIQVLTNADMLIEGFDAPRASVCINLRPTFSPVVAEQRGGRVLRINPLDPEKHAYIVDFIDQNKNTKNQPISFAQIAEAAVILGRTRVDYGNTTPRTGDRSPRADIKVAGLRVHTSTDEVMRIVGKIVEQKYVRAPEGWLNNFGVKKITDRSPLTVQRHAEKYREEHPEWFQYYLDSGGRVVEFFDPRLVDILANRLAIAHTAPEGWLNVKNLADASSRSTQTVKLITARLLKEHPEWQKRYLDSGKQVRDYFSPELSELALKELTQYPKAPEGWRHTTSLVRSLHARDEIIRRIAGKFQDEHPEWFGTYLDSTNNPILHYSPELVQLIADEAMKRQPAPEGWLTLSAVSKLAGRDISTIQRLAAAKEGQRGIYLNSQGKATSHLSPEGVKEILDQVKQFKPAPEGWLSATQISETTHRSWPSIRKFMRQHIKEHPGWFATHLDTSNNPTTYYSSEASTIIIQDASKHTQPPEGWMNAQQLRDVLWKNSSITRNRFNRYKEIYPQWFGEHLDSVNRVTQYYAPELIELVLREK